MVNLSSFPLLGCSPFYKMCVRLKAHNERSVAAESTFNINKHSRVSSSGVYTNTTKVFKQKEKKHFQTPPR